MGSHQGNNEKYNYYRQYRKEFDAMGTLRGTMYHNWFQPAGQFLLFPFNKVAQPSFSIIATESKSLNSCNQQNSHFSSRTTKLDELCPPIKISIQECELSSMNILVLRIDYVEHLVYKLLGICAAFSCLIPSARRRVGPE